MSGIGSIVLAFWAMAFPPSDNGKALLLSGAATCFVIGAYRIWATQHGQVLNELAKNAKPDIAGEILEISIDEILVSDGRWPAASGSFINIKAYIVNRSQVETTVKGFGLELQGVSIEDPTIDGSNLLISNIRVSRQENLFNFAHHVNDASSLTLRRGIAKEGWVRFFLYGTAYKEVSDATIAMTVIDAWGTHHRIPCSPNVVPPWKRQSGISSY